MDKLMKVEVDMAYDQDEGFDAAVRNSIGGRPIAAEVIMFIGPAGGWPFVRFIGTEADLTAMLDEHWEGWRENLEEGESLFEDVEIA